jgi:hypothetical protein
VHAELGGSSHRRPHFAHRRIPPRQDEPRLHSCRCHRPPRPFSCGCRGVCHLLQAAAGRGAALPDGRHPERQSAFFTADCKKPHFGSEKARISYPSQATAAERCKCHHQPKTCTINAASKAPKSLVTSDAKRRLWRARREGGPHLMSACFRSAFP